MSESRSTQGVWHAFCLPDTYSTIYLHAIQNMPVFGALLTCMAELWDPKPFVVVVVVFKFRFPQQLFYSTDLNSTSETKSCYNRARVVALELNLLRTAVNKPNQS